MTYPNFKPVSLLDTDLYKFTMQQAVMQKFPTVQSTYRFKNRSPDMLFSRECIDTFKQLVSSISTLALTPSEYVWLKSTCPYFTPEYLSYLSRYHFNPNQVIINFVPSRDDQNRGSLDMEIVGPWVETILWEVPLMSMLSETYFSIDDHDWNYDGQEELAYKKGMELLRARISFSEFGTRRRRSFQTQDHVISGLKRASEEHEGTQDGRLLGTSNVYLAYKYGIKASGTMGHEWFMAVGAYLGYEHANAKALDLWHQVYGTDNLIALTDTFTTEAFFKDFSIERGKLWTGLRQDSGDPFVYAPRAKAVYERLGIDPSERIIVYSDGLNVDLAKRLNEQCGNMGMKAMFGIGTHFTNDFHTKSSYGKKKSKPLNIVIKIASINGHPCVKLSDELTKHTGDPATIQEVKQAFGLDVITKPDSAATDSSINITTHPKD